jgi:hypothetical protein
MIVHDLHGATESVLNPCKRTIFFEGRRFLLSLPKIIFKSTYGLSYINVLNENSNLCYAPFPNIRNTLLCTSSGSSRGLENSDVVMSDFLNSEFALPYNLPWANNLVKYVDITQTKGFLIKEEYCINAVEKVYDFYQKWQDDGKLNLIEYS